MTARTSREIVTFTRPFFLSGIGEVQPAGSYRVETEEEEIPGLSFSAYRRVATLMILPARPGSGIGEQVATIDRWSCRPRRSGMRTRRCRADSGPPIALGELAGQRSPRKPSTRIMTTTTPMSQKMLCMCLYHPLVRWSRGSDPPSLPCRITPCPIMGSAPPDALIGPHIKALAARPAH